MSEPRFVIASDVKVRPVDWLWWPYVPLGKITAFAGRMGQGKTLWTEWLAAAVSTAQGVNLKRPAGVVMLCAEDDAEDTTVPRLKALGADLSRVALIPGSTLDLGVITQACEGVDARLITVDPFTHYVPGNRNAYKSQDVRLVLAPLVELARQRGLAAVVVQHVNRSADTTDALDRIADSQGLPQVARSVLIWGPDPQDPDGDQGTRKVLTRPKNNLTAGTATPAASFQIKTARVDGAGVQPRLAYVGTSDARPDDVVATHEVRTRTDEAMVFLRDQLAGGPIEVKQVEGDAADAGIGVHALRTARNRLTRSYRPGGNSGPYVLELRSVVAAVVEAAHTPHNNHQQPPTTTTENHNHENPWLSVVDGGCGENTEDTDTGHGSQTRTSEELDSIVATWSQAPRDAVSAQTQKHTNARPA